MEKKKYYSKKQNTHNNHVPSITKPFAFDNRVRYQKGHQNQLLNASRKTETYSQDKTVIVTESVNIGLLWFLNGGLLINRMHRILSRNLLLLQ